MLPNNWWKALVVAGFFVAIATPRLCAQDREKCLHFFGKSSRPERFECISALFSQAPIHLTIGNIAPSNGFPIGVVVGREFNSTNPTTGASMSETPSLTFVGSTNGSWGVHGNIDWFPPAVVNEHKSPSCHEFLHHCTIEPPRISLRVTYLSIQTVYFYGIGPLSPPTKFLYGENQLVGGINVEIPIINGLDFVGSAEGSKTQLKRETGVSSLNLNFTDASAPGLSLQPAYVHSSFGLRFKAKKVFEPKESSSPIKPRLTYSWNGTGAYHSYSDMGQGPYSFQQFTFTSIRDDAMTFHFGGINKKPNSSAGNWLFCGRKKEDQCDFGKLSLGTMLVLSRTTGNNVVPFYYQPTLGGSDINSIQSLRGYDNYRFRGPDAALVQVDYAITQRALKNKYNSIGPYIFYDAGNVGLNASNLSPAHWRQDAGGGLYFTFVGNIVAEAYIAGGAGHGPHYGYSLNRFF
jgi:hypothetical protein